MNLIDKFEGLFGKTTQGPWRVENGTKLWADVIPVREEESPNAQFAAVSHNLATELIELLRCCEILSHCEIWDDDPAMSQVLPAQNAYSKFMTALAKEVKE